MAIERSMLASYARATLAVAIVALASCAGKATDRPAIEVVTGRATPPPETGELLDALAAERASVARERARSEALEAEVARLRDERASAPEYPGAGEDGGIFRALLERVPEDVRRYNEHITTLANPFFEGRAPGTFGGRHAADYVEWHFKQFGLVPAFADETDSSAGATVLTPNTTYRQSVPFGRELKIERGAVSAGGVDFAPERDFTVLGMSGKGDATAPLAFAGYSISSGPNGYATYAGEKDLEGRIALVLRFEPITPEGTSQWAEAGWSGEAGLAGKLRAAQDQGAVGVIFVNPPGAKDPRATRLITLDESDTGSALDIPVVMMSIDACDRLVRGLDGRSLEDLRAMADGGGGVVALGDAPVTIAAELRTGSLDTANVGGVLPGKGGLKDEYIVIGAHLDHVGYGYTGTATPGRLHPGADDNASGSCGLLLAAEKLASEYAELPEGASARSILFLAFTAEEAGLIGSRHYVRNPSVPTDRIAFMLNMDMIGRLREGTVELDGANSAAGLSDWIAPYFGSSGLEWKPSTIGGGRSDHASFLSARIPVLFFFTGLHDEYHTPSDFSYLINREGAVQVVNLAVSLAMGLAQREEAWEFQRGGRRATPAPAEEGAQAPAPPAGQEPADDQPRQFTVRVRFGIMPGDYAEDARGVLIGDVTEGTSAAEAGLKPGDVMTKWNGKELTTVESWMPLLAEHQPGDVVEITFRRNGEEHTTKCTLKPRG